MNIERIASLRAQGIKPSQIATIVGVSPARISQIVATDEFQLILKSKEEEFKEKDIEEMALSAKYLSIEHSLLQQMNELLPSAELRDVTAALRVVSERQEKMKTRNSPSQQGNSTQVIVAISLPSHAVPRRTISLTNQMEVTAIGEQTLAPLHSQSVISLFSSMKGEQNESSTSIKQSKASPIETLPEEDFLSFCCS